MAEAPRQGPVIVAEPSIVDVLMGRGNDMNNASGNERFRSLVEQHKGRYRDARNRREKKLIAQSIYLFVHAIGGKFLKRNHDQDAMGWIEVEEDVAIEKCMQALREKWKPGDDNGNSAKRAIPPQPQTVVTGIASTRPTSTASATGTVVGDNAVRARRHQLQSTAGVVAYNARPPLMAYAVGDASMAFAVPSFYGYTPIGIPASFMPILPPTTFANPAETTMFYPVNNNPCWGVQQFLMSIPRLPPSWPAVPDGMAMPMGQVHPPAKDVEARRIPPTSESTGKRKEMTSTTSNDTFVARGELKDVDSSGIASFAIDSPVMKASTNSGTLLLDSYVRNDAGGNLKDDASAASVPAGESPGAVSEFLISILADPQQPIYTETEAAQERATVTHDEELEAMMDLFGKFCVDKKGKRAKRQLEVSPLIKEMRDELERIPVKEALVEAQAKCHPEEFSDARLERFLRCEDMHVKKGAQRFVNYWQDRRDVFGAPRYTARMTLTEALDKDDLVALETGVIRFLPSLDASGRQILYLEPRLHSRKDYMSDNLLRAYWYVMEIAAQSNAHEVSGVVMIIFEKNATIWEYDHIYSRTSRFNRTCWPIMLISTHICAPNWFSSRVIRPVLWALVSKQFRLRTVIHDDSEDDALLQALSTYGLEKNMLPCAMGGGDTSTMIDWIADRRAIEMEEV